MEPVVQLILVKIYGDILLKNLRWYSIKKFMVVFHLKIYGGILLKNLWWYFT